MLNIFGKGTSQAKKRCSFICKKIVVSPVPDNSFLKGVFFSICNFFLFLILQKHALGVTNLSPPIHQSINILVVFLVSQNIPFLFLKKKCCRQCLTFHPSEQCFFAICLLFFYNLPFIFSFSILQKKMLSPMSHLPSIRAVGAVVTDVIAPTGNWLLHSLI